MLASLGALLAVNQLLAFNRLVSNQRSFMSYNGKSMNYASAINTRGGHNLALHAEAATNAPALDRLTAIGHQIGQVEVNQGGVTSIEHIFTVPLNWDQALESQEKDGQTGETIQIFVRELTMQKLDPNHLDTTTYADSLSHRSLPALLYLQGGPGYESPRWVRPADGGWSKRALEEFRVFLLDQRGTGRSSVVNHQSLLRRFPPQSSSPSSSPSPSPSSSAEREAEAEEDARADAMADFLSLFRADSIVKDCEAIRKAVLLLQQQEAEGEEREEGEEQGEGGGKKEAIRTGTSTSGKWTVLGQSYGGFCLLHYLSAYPASVHCALFTGGLPPVDRSAAEVYQATYRRVVERNRMYYERFPQDINKVHQIVRYLDTHSVPLPSGGALTPRRFLQLGLLMGMRTGFDVLHNLLEHPWLYELPPPNNTGTSSGDSEVCLGEEIENELKYSFLRQVESFQSFDSNPLYAILHESIYCIRTPTKRGKPGKVEGSGISSGNTRGGGGGIISDLSCSGWSAQRVVEEDEEFKHLYDWKRRLYGHNDQTTATSSTTTTTTSSTPLPLLFTGEMVYRWMFEGDYPTLSLPSSSSSSSSPTTTLPLLKAADKLAYRRRWGGHFVKKKNGNEGEGGEGENEDGDGSYSLLYDPSSLRQCPAQCAAAIYYDDIYVERLFSEETAKLLPRMRVWVTNEYEHSGLRDDGYRILSMLLDLAREKTHMTS